MKRSPNRTILFDQHKNPYIEYTHKKGGKNCVHGIMVDCAYCGTSCFVLPKQLKNGKLPCCSAKCARNARKTKPHKNGIAYCNGRKHILNPTHPNATLNKRYVVESRLVISTMLNRPLTSKELVHHINEDINDNRPENLMVVSRKEHNRIHGTLRRYNAKRNRY